MTDAAIKLFVEDARAVTIAAAASRLGLKLTGKLNEHPQPCPNCGGDDTFAFNTKKNAWNCRAGGKGGRDAIGMAAHCLDLDVNRRGEFLDACAAVLDRDIPEAGERESVADKAAREERIAERQRQNQANAAARAASQVDFRERERQKSRGIVEHASPLSATGAGAWPIKYLGLRGCPDFTDRRWLRGAADQTYWHGQDERDQPLALMSGPAMIAPFIGPDLALIGCHITWIDLDRPPKFRPVPFGLTRKGIDAKRPEWRFGDAAPSYDDLAAELYERLPAKKMRGSKKGGLIPLCGDPAALRWLGGEGIENGCAFAGWEGFRADTFYFAAGDLGNLAGPADPALRFAHPTLTKLDKAGRTRPIMVAGPVPHPAREADDAMWVADHVDDLVLLCDGDSEPVMTAAAMARARARHARPGRRILLLWPKHGRDFAQMAAEAGQS